MALILRDIGTHPESASLYRQPVLKIISLVFLLINHQRGRCRDQPSSPLLNSHAS